MHLYDLYVHVPVHIDSFASQNHSACRLMEFNNLVSTIYRFLQREEKNQYVLQSYGRYDNM